jgi:molybdopterin-binding protein
VIRPEDLLVSRTPFPDYPRNRFTAVVVRAERQGPVTNIHLEVRGHQLMASITTLTAESLALRPGDEVLVALKATAVHLL